MEGKFILFTLLIICWLNYDPFLG